MLLTQTLKQPCSQMLQALEKWMRKASDCHEPQVILGKRLAPDMYPLASQVCFACFLVQEAICRLSGKKVPEEVLELRQRGWGADEHPIEFTELISMIGEARKQLASLGEKELDKPQNEPISFSLPDGMTFELQHDEFLQDWTMPQFYFHICIAYAIMRNNSVPLGKVDYVGHMLRYVRN